MAEYTSGMENELFETIPSYEEEEDCRALIDILNSSEFRTFGDALKHVINLKKTDETINEMEYLISSAKEKGINIADKRTIKSWFEAEKRPKKGQENRYTMFKIAFALGLSEEETKRLFKAVYLDRAFNPRDYKDVIFYYCLRTKKTWDDAQRMIENVVLADEEASDETIYTQLLINKLEDSEEENKLVEFINHHPHNFTISNVTALQKKNEYLEAAKKYALIERQRKNSIWSGEEKKLSDSYGRNQDSTNYLYETITECEINKSRGTSFTFKNALLPKEIKNCFPTPHTLSASEPTYEELRKLIILLFSYAFWSKMKDDETCSFDDYRDDLDELLTDIGYLPLYAGNPYDWLFLRCTLSERPLDMFRDILSEVKQDI